MNSIKIICDAYTKEISYFLFDERENNWTDLSEVKSSPFSKSKMGSNDYLKTTISHKAYEIIDEIDKNYNKSNKGIKIIFEGTDDDYYELCDIIKNSFSERIIECDKGAFYLESASQVMPKIKRVYESLEELFSEQDDDEIRELISKYEETVKPEICVCVMGLYSSGKSSLINALIGKEVLVSDSDPATAKVYKINSDNITWIEFRFDGSLFHIEFTKKETIISPDVNSDLVNAIRNEMVNDEDEETRLYKTITILNQYALNEGKEREAKIFELAQKENDSSEEYLQKHEITDLVNNGLLDEYRLDDLIEIGVEFSDNTLLRVKEYKYVIFDTPGSNSASHKEHLEILKKVLKERTNGLPILVTNPDTLDGTDNMPVIKMIEDLGSALDITSTMVVINKADEKPRSTLQQKKDKATELKVTSWKKNRIFFVSSIVSLGQKINNPIEADNWKDKEYADIYYNFYKKFDGSDERSLLELYKYNILPQNIMDQHFKMVDDIKENGDVISWNAGIRSVEMEVGRFGEKYALYNKCIHAENYLNSAINKLEEKKKEASNSINETTKAIDDAIAEEIKTLINSLEECCNLKKANLDNCFSDRVTGSTVSKYINRERVKERVQLQKNYADTHKKEWKIGDYGDYCFKRIDEKYKQDVIEYTKEVNDKSKQFWDKGIKELKDAMLKIVYSSDKLSEKQRDIAKDIVMNAGEVKPYAGKLYSGEGSGIKNYQILWVKWQVLDVDKATDNYLSNLVKSLQSKNNELSLNSTKSFNSWKSDLLSELRKRVPDLNPNLKEYYRVLKAYKEQYSCLEKQLEQVKESKERIADLRSFREVE